ncbi:sulfotransferase [Actinomadura fulvescens]|uniref:sulfotransferase family protein n=1 Tax=Actinomadura fulvescens TaxID=46160 RepID=UPI0039780E59
MIGAGLARTGTVSLTAAVEELGFTPCFHMRKVMADPGTAQAWLRASRGEPADWERIFDGYQASVGLPGARFWRELVERYPEAKVVLTVREPEQWYDSVRHTISDNDLKPPAGQAEPHLAAMLEVIQELVHKGLFKGRLSDAEYAMDVFNQHNAQVRSAVPPDRLLEYRVTDGWGPLCDFLGVPVPDAPFPRRNDRKQFAEFMRAGRRRDPALPE